MRYAVKELGLGELLDQAVHLLRDHFQLLMGITAYLLIPFGLLQGFTVYFLMPDLVQNPDAMNEAFTQRMLIASMVNGLLSLVLLIVVWPLTDAAAIWAVASEYLGRPTTARASMKQAIRRILPLLLVKLLVFAILVASVVPGAILTAVLAALIHPVLMAIGFAVMLVPFIYLSFRFWLAVNVLMIEETDVLNALKRSGALMRGNMSKAFVLGLVLFLIGLLAGLSTQLIPVRLLQTVAQVFVQAVTYIFGAAATVVFYFSCRCKHEHFDLAILAEAVAEEEAPPASEAL